MTRRHPTKKRLLAAKQRTTTPAMLPMWSVVSMVGIVLPVSKVAAPHLRPSSLPTTPADNGGVGWLDDYRRFASEHYVATAACQMGAVRGVADLVGQHLQGATSVDPVHLAAMILAGLTISGAGNAVWLRHLERRIGPTDGAPSVLRKSALDYVCWAPVVNAANLLCVSLLTALP